MKRNIKAYSYLDEPLYKQAENIADHISEFLDATSRLPDLEDWLDQYDLEHLGNAMDCLYDFAQMYANKDGMMSGCKTKKKSVTAAEDWPPEMTYNEFEEGDQLMEGFIEALESMGLYSEPSGYGSTYTDFILREEDGEELFSISGKDEERMLTRFFNTSTSKYDYHDKIKKWIKEKIKK